MTRYTLTLAFVFASLLLGAQNNTKGAIITFTETTYVFPIVQCGQSVEHKFYFTNTGDLPLIIQEAFQGPVFPPAFPKEPISPGDTGFISLSGISKSETGCRFTKSVTVKSNATNGDIVLTIIGPDPNEPLISFDSTTFSFDTVPQGTVITHEFHFKNTGKSPLLLTDAPTGCGCMVAEFPKEPIAPGKSGKVTVKLSLAGKSGHQHKIVTLKSNNSTGDTYLHMKGYVKLLLYLISRDD